MSILRSATTAILTASAVACVALTAVIGIATADETCQSPYLAKITGQEDFVYIWTLGVWVSKGSETDPTSWLRLAPTRVVPITEKWFRVYPWGGATKPTTAVFPMTARGSGRAASMTA